MSHTTHAYVRCCERTKEHNLIFLSLNELKFYFEGIPSSHHFDQSIEYCPWCGQLLDMNLLEN